MVISLSVKVKLAAFWDKNELFCKSSFMFVILPLILSNKVVFAVNVWPLPFKLAENEDGKSVFTTSDEVYDFIDDCRLEGITANDLYEKIAEALNEEGFFKKKMSKKELKEMTSNPLSTMNMNDLVQKSAESAMSKIAEKQFQEQGFQGYEA